MSEKEKRKRIEVEAATPEPLPEGNTAAGPAGARDAGQPEGHETPQQPQAGTPTDSRGAKEESGDCSELRREVERLRGEANEFKERYLRALAELENFRRRMQEERARQIQYANEKLLRELLPILDDLERALQVKTDSAEALRKGVEMILQKLRQTLEAFGVEAMETVGEAFDPYMHEAVDRVVTSEVPEGTIVSELQRGYRYHERLLRPARVRVAVAPEDEQTDQGQGEQSGRDNG